MFRPLHGPHGPGAQKPPKCPRGSKKHEREFSTKNGNGWDSRAAGHGSGGSRSSPLPACTCTYPSSGLSCPLVSGTRAPQWTDKRPRLGLVRDKRQLLDTSPAFAGNVGAHVIKLYRLPRPAVGCACVLSCCRLSPLYGSARPSFLAQPSLVQGFATYTTTHPPSLQQATKAGRCACRGSDVYSADCHYNSPILATPVPSLPIP